MLEQDLQACLSRLLEESTQTAENTLHGDASLRQIEGWDSMGIVMFIGLVKQRLGVELGVHAVSQRETVADLCAHVAEHLPGQAVKSRHPGS